MDTSTPAEIAVRVAGALLDMSDQRRPLVHALTRAVEHVVTELDPDRRRDTSPTWWQDLPAWERLDGLDRLRRAHDQLLVLEEQAGFVIADLRAGLAGQPAPARPNGHSPRQAHSLLMSMAFKRSAMLKDLADATRSRTLASLDLSTSRELRGAIRALVGSESKAHEERLRLSALLDPLDATG